MKKNPKRQTRHAIKQWGGIGEKPIVYASCSANKLIIVREGERQIQSKKKRGFTLLEVCLVVCIFGFILSLAIPSGMAWIEAAKTDYIHRHEKHLNEAIELVMLRNSDRGKTWGEVVNPKRMNELESLLKGGFEGYQIKGYTLDWVALQSCSNGYAKFYPVYGIYRK